MDAEELLLLRVDPLDPPDERLVWMSGKPERGERLVDLPDRRPQPPARRREDHDVVNEADVEEPRPLEGAVEVEQEERAKDRAQWTPEGKLMLCCPVPAVRLGGAPEVLADQVQPAAVGHDAGETVEEPGVVKWSRSTTACRSCRRSGRPGAR